MFKRSLLVARFVVDGREVVMLGCLVMLVGSIDMML
jgi:hypothetical protein